MSICEELECRAPCLTVGRKMNERKVTLGRWGISELTWKAKPVSEASSRAPSSLTISLVPAAGSHILDKCLLARPPAVRVVYGWEDPEGCRWDRALLQGQPLSNHKAHREVSE